VSSIQQDLPIFNKFDFDRPPVGVKFLPNKPDGIKRLDKILDFARCFPKHRKETLFTSPKKISPAYNDRTK
jgi:hypothetical protein